MTVDLATVVQVVGLVATVAGATGWVIRQLVMDRIARNDKSIASFGVRLQALKEWQVAHDAVEGERARRETRGIPQRSDGGE
jgi:hypothetical protein